VNKTKFQWEFSKRRIFKLVITTITTKKLKKALKRTLAEDIKTARAKLDDKRLKAKLKKREARRGSDDDDEEGPRIAVLGSGGSN